jgi:hypothetical protein
MFNFEHSRYSVGLPSGIDEGGHCEPLKEKEQKSTGRCDQHLQQQKKLRLSHLPLTHQTRNNTLYLLASNISVNKIHNCLLYINMQNIQNMVKPVPNISSNIQ